MSRACRRCASVSTTGAALGSAIAAAGDVAALEAARLGGVGHISDAMIKTVTDRRYKTKYVKAKQALYKYNVDSIDKSAVKFDLGDLAAIHE